MPQCLFFLSRFSYFPWWNVTLQRIILSLWLISRVIKQLILTVLLVLFLLCMGKDFQRSLSFSRTSLSMISLRDLSNEKYFIDLLMWLPFLLFSIPYTDKYLNISFSLYMKGLSLMFSLVWDDLWWISSGLYICNCNFLAFIY